MVGELSYPRFMFDAKSFSKKKLPMPKKPVDPSADPGAGPGGYGDPPEYPSRGGSEERVSQGVPRTSPDAPPNYLQAPEEDPNGPPSSEREMLGLQEEDPASEREEKHGSFDDGAPFDETDQRADMGMADLNDKGAQDFQNDMPQDEDQGPLSQRGAQIADQTRDPYAGNDAVSTIDEIEQRKNPMRAWATFKKTSSRNPVSMIGQNQADQTREG